MEKMKIYKIHSIQWSNVDHTSVFVVADTNQGNGLSIGTPYDKSSIIWDSVKAFPLENIAEYVSTSDEIAEDQNKMKASQLLSESDWVFQPDVSDESSFPRLSNKTDFIQYRAKLRSIIVNKQAGAIDWPQKPSAKWIIE